jgi:hypothetical protein
MADVLGYEGEKFGGAFKAWKTRVHFTGGGQKATAGMLVQDFQSQYAMSINRIWELASDPRTYYIIGRPQGQFNMGRLAGPEPLISTFISTFTDACNAAKNIITVDGEPGFCDENGAVVHGGRRKLKFTSCLLSSVGFRINSGDMMMAQQLGGIFHGMEYDGPPEQAPDQRANDLA